MVTNCITANKSISSFKLCPSTERITHIKNTKIYIDGLVNDCNNSSTNTSVEIKNAQYSVSSNFSSYPEKIAIRKALLE